MVRPLGMGIVVMFVLLGTAVTSAHADNDKSGFFVGLGYGLSVSQVHNFKINDGGETRWLFPFHERVHREELHSANFYWGPEVASEIRFQRGNTTFGGSAGYLFSAVRLEIDLTHERSEILKSGLQKGRKGGGMPFVLGKHKAMVSLQRGYDRIDLIGSLSRENVIAIEKYMVSELGYDQLRRLSVMQEEELRRVNKTKKVVGAFPENRSDNFFNLLDLMIVQSVLFTKALALTVEGAEVIEIMAIRNTTATLNLCYDFPSMELVKLNISPYTCAGIGGSVIGITKGHANLQLSYKLKLGLNYRFRSNAVAYIGTAYQKVLGSEYYNVPLKRLVDDISPTNSVREKTSVGFGLQYVGLELGARVSF
ncbi:P44/Msp2 family outer membrane protein [Anaplasma phagocytophilum]|uniref:Major surface protein 2 n=1 Tax=Anaplasma phagocytophilum TaxID=948 RepID=A0A098EFF2_ANAPH|nr:P44/Msp2 family outer membrane protein [Anaplasma phagocytophilum]CEG20993.1 Major surface protein 2 [Anaplasma phagocytophilum]